MPRYYCDYCDNYLTHDSVRPPHSGRLPRVLAAELLCLGCQRSTARMHSSMCLSRQLRAQCLAPLNHDLAVCPLGQEHLLPDSDPIQMCVVFGTEAAQLGVHAQSQCAGLLPPVRAAADRGHPRAQDGRKHGPHGQDERSSGLRRAGWGAPCPAATRRPYAPSWWRHAPTTSLAASSNDEASPHDGSPCVTLPPFSGGLCACSDRFARQLQQRDILLLLSRRACFEPVSSRLAPRLFTQVASSWRCSTP